MLIKKSKMKTAAYVTLLNKTRKIIKKIIVPYQKARSLFMFCLFPLAQAYFLIKHLMIMKIQCICPAFGIYPEVKMAKKNAVSPKIGAQRFLFSERCAKRKKETFFFYIFIIFTKYKDKKCGYEYTKI